MRDAAAEAEEQEADATASTRRTLRERWASLTPRGRRGALAATAALLVAVGLVVWFGLTLTVGKVSWRDVAFRVTGPRAVVVKFEVTKPPSMTAHCTVEAQEVAHAVVGRTVVEVPPSANRTVTQEVTVRTSSLAVIGTVRRCTEG